MQTPQKRIGYGFLAAATVSWGIFPVVGMLGIKQAFPPIFFVAVITIMAGLMIGAMLLAKKQLNFWDSPGVKPMVWAGLLISVAFYGLIFTGLKHTSAGNESLLMVSEVAYTFVIMHFINHERYEPIALKGAFLMLLGAMLVVFQGSFNPQLGDVIILVACAIPPLGNYFKKKARKSLNSSQMLLIRSVIGGVFLLLISALFEGSVVQNFELIKPFWWQLALFAFVCFVLNKIFFFEAMHRLSIALTIAVSICALPVFTIILAYFILGEIPTWWQLAGFVPLCIGACLVLFKKDIFRILE